MKIVKHIAKHDKHWVMIQTRIVYDKRLSPMALKLLLHLLICNNKEYFPTIHRIAKQFDVSTNSIDRAVTTLKKAGYLQSYGKRKDVTWHIWEQPKFINPTDEVNKDEMIITIDPTDGVKEGKIDEIINPTIDPTSEVLLLRNNIAGHKSAHQSNIPIEENKERVQLDVEGTDAASSPSETTHPLPSTMIDENGKIQLPIGRDLTNDERKIIQDWLPF